MDTLNKLFVVLTLGMASLATQAADITRFIPKVEYSADQTMETNEGSMSGKVYVSKDKERREMNASGQAMTMIIRKDKKLGWTLMPAEKMYMEMSFAEVMDKQPENPDNYKIETTDMGSETVNGIKADKIKVTMTDKQDGRKMSGYWWVTADGIIVKMDVAPSDNKPGERVRLTLSNLKVGKQSPALFEIPAGYNKFTMPSMKDMMRGMQDMKSMQKDEEDGGGMNMNDLMKMMR